MATKATKTTKKADKAASTSVDFSTMSGAELAAYVNDKRSDLATLRQSHRAGELVNPRAITAARKDIARALTALNNVTDEEEK